MFTKKTLGIALAGALALGAFSGTAMAAPTNVDGVIIDPSSPINLTIDAINFRESSVMNPGDVLTGYGQLASINGTDKSVFCPGCDVNFKFNYTLKSVDNSSGTNQVVFDAGTINFYVDNTNSFDVTDPTTAGVGTLWLTLTGHTAAYTGFTDIGQLYSTVVGPVANPGAQSSGFGLLDSTGGTAMAYFDTNTQADGADFAFSSSFLTKIANGCTNPSETYPTTDLCYYPISGTAELTSSNNVPEPGAAGMLGLGLAALGLFARRRRNEANGRA